MDAENHNFIHSMEQYWTCSISKTLMKDPVITSDGHTYERQGIVPWLQSNRKSPLTGLPLPSTDLIPNISFKILVDKLTAELPAFLAKEEGLKTCISQLKEEIDYLHIQLRHGNERNDEYLQKEDKEFRTRRIEKTRHENKNIQLKHIRDQKNAFQKENQQLRVKDQQKNREIRLLKEELSNLQAKYTEASKARKEFEEDNEKINSNRSLMMHKIRGTFKVNLTFIGHLLQSIEDAKVYEAQKGTEKTIDVQGLDENVIPELDQEISQIPLNNIPNQRINQRRDVIAHLERLVRERINGDLIEADSEESPQKRMQRKRARHQLNFYRQISREERNIGHNSIEHMPQQHSFMYRPQVQGMIARQNRRNQMRPQAAQPQSNQPIQNLFNTQPQNIDSQDFQQVQSIKWLMSKRSYRCFPLFYDYKFISENMDPKRLWFGVRIRVLESRIPFVEYLNHWWKHVRILDLSACNVDDELWQRFIQKSENFQQVALLDLDRNNLTTVRKTDLEKFPNLKQVLLNRNKLTKDSLEELRKFAEENSHVKVQYKHNEGEENNDSEML